MIPLFFKSGVSLLHRGIATSSFAIKSYAMNLSLKNEVITLSKDVEIIAVIKESRCIEEIVSTLKTSQIQSELLWIKDPLKVVDYLEKRRGYENKPTKEGPMVFVFDGRFGVESFEYLKLKVEQSPIAEKSRLLVYPEGLSPLEKEIFHYKQVEFIDCDKIRDFVF